jgi:hypothetical protein
VAAEGLADGKPIIVRFGRGRAAATAAGGIDWVGDGVIPERTAGMEADGRAPGIKDGRGDEGGAGVF